MILISCSNRKLQLMLLFCTKFNGNERWWKISVDSRKLHYIFSLNFMFNIYDIWRIFSEGRGNVDRVNEPIWFPVVYKIYKKKENAKNCSHKCKDSAFPTPEAALLLVRTKNRGLREGSKPEIRDSRTSRHSAHAQSQVR